VEELKEGKSNFVIFNELTDLLRGLQDSLEEIFSFGLLSGSPRNGRSKFL
jgi:hypothetical protein